MKYALLCSGQAGQSAELLDALLAAPDLADLRALAGELLGEPLERWWRGLGHEGVFENSPAQFAIALYQIAAWMRLKPLLPPPAVVAGYSLGEVLAWHITGALDARATLQLVRERAALMDRHAPAAGGGLLLWRGRSTPAMRAARDRCMQAHGLAIAIQRPDGSLVLGGTRAGIARFLAEPELAGVDLRPLPVSVPSHTPLLAGAVQPFAERIASTPFRPIDTAVLAGIDARPQHRQEEAVVSLSSQLAGTLRWDWCTETLLSLGVAAAIELGPGKDLATQLQTCAGIPARALSEFGSPAACADWLQAH
jgi:[acyl-carrier-protein] S-malonyltransferase